MRVTAFYHVWGGGSWQTPLDEYRAALEQSKFPGRVFYCMAGEPDPNEWIKHGAIVAEWQREGNEAVTINALRRYALHHEDEVILYAHTKGAATVTPFRDAWRRSMTERVVRRWRYNLELLESGDFDAVGCHWISPEEWGDMLAPRDKGARFFAGNFWLATCSYLRTLPVCEPEPRTEAEAWIGRHNPRIVDLCPGWPHDNRWTEPCV